MKDEADFLSREMSFAQVVSTEKGDALLIAGRVYQVTGPDGNAADLFARALRGVGRGSGGWAHTPQHVRLAGTDKAPQQSWEFNNPPLCDGTAS